MSKKRWAAVAVLFLGLPVAFVLLPNSVFYKERRPRRLGTLVNRLEGRWSGLGLPPSRQVSLEVKGRVSGKVRATPVVIATHEGERYLVSMLGENVEWVANVRASGGSAVLRHGRRRQVILEEVPPAGRAPILKAYLHAAPGARPHFDVARDAPLAEFEAVADGYPVFRIREVPAT
jgi:deazaflavin-dependent oxidoreductase (nitroreductase family)